MYPARRPRRGRSRHRVLDWSVRLKVPAISVVRPIEVLVLPGSSQPDLRAAWLVRLIQSAAWDPSRSAIWEPGVGCWQHARSIGVIDWCAIDQLGQAGNGKSLMAAALTFARCTRE